jgi:hypothetical protein
VKIVNESIQILKDEGFEPQICAFFWMQGESDSYATDLVENYIRRYDNLLKDFQKQFGLYLSTCIYVDAGISENWLYYKELNALKEEYSKKRGYYLDTVKEGLTTKNEPTDNPDTAHYDSDSIVKLGEMFAGQITFEE